MTEVVLTVKMPRELYEAVKEAARGDDRTVSSYVRECLRRSTRIDSDAQEGG